ncbi:rhomboid-like protein [Geosmithia morbida]|uniref:Rhomboid-like protein n=1 Tax=Geosmithia morbida TaxID=1094350 RepID=A0A9P4YVT7_9HYPO|nr:rhomboid-like protein [Geosmithia morbida]KAF4124028.1 rhomboid-like protein [Geosmithia morbida]
MQSGEEHDDEDDMPLAHGDDAPAPPTADPSHVAVLPSSEATSPWVLQRRAFFGGGNRVIRDYVDLPRDYKDRTGLAFRRKEDPLSQEEVERIFGGDSQLRPASANYLLRVLHGRRVAGTLDDPTLAVNTMHYDEGDVARALAHLRETVKVDEVLNAGLRAEDELAQLEEAEAEAEMQKQEQERKQEQEQEQGQEQQARDEAEAAAAAEGLGGKIEVEYRDDPVYGRSRFDAIRARNEARDLARLKAMEEADRRREEEALRKAAELGGTGVVVYDRKGRAAHSLVEVGEGQRPITNPKIAEYHRAAMSDEAEPEAMSLWRRVWPSAAAWLLGVGLMGSLTVVYEEPADRHRLFPQVSAATATVGALVAVNVAVWVLWRVPPLWRVLNRHMMLVVGRPRPLSLLTANFSHIELGHLAVNMATLVAGGIHLHEDLGRMGYLTLFLACGSAGFLGSLAVYGARGMLQVSSMGSSAASIGVLAAYFWEHRDDRFRFLGLPQDGVHGIVWWALLVGYYVYEGLSVFALRNRSDVVSHWAGLMAGMAGIQVMDWAGVYYTRSMGV